MRLMIKKDRLKITDECADRVRGISAADVICGGDEKELLAHWYGATQDLWNVYQLIEEQANKYDLCSNNQLNL